MKRLICVVLASAPCALLLSVPCFADPLFQFTLTGDGHIFAFTVPNPPTVVEAPHLIDVSLGSVSGSVDGIGGYRIAGYSVAEENTGSSPELVLYASPDPAGIAPPYPTGSDEYDLFGPTLTTLVSDVPNPAPVCYPGGVCNDFLTFAYVPGKYSFQGFDPDRRLTAYTVDIAAAEATGVAPEPPSLLLALGGLAGTAWAQVRRRRSSSHG